MHESREQITLDGPAASGKSTLASMVAQKLSAYYVNTGDMYRTLTWAVVGRNIDVNTEQSKIIELLDSVDIKYTLAEDQKLVLSCEGKLVEYSQIRAPKITQNVSIVATIPEVRQWLVKRQRQSAELGLIVMEGRDIGTVVFPQANYKFYVTASPLVRAQRRLAQDGEVAEGVTVETVAADIARRDEMDMNRKVSPLRPAEDSILIDTSEMNIEQAVEKIIATVKEKRNLTHA
ncbi:MAG: (d)CMP kinase [Lentisphaeraceae bacterium]|nr:(d)CMP kinase [Lentisphaeraceae bacterium]